MFCTFITIIRRTSSETPDCMLSDIGVNGKCCGACVVIIIVSSSSS